MAATRKFYVRRDTTPIKKAEQEGVVSNGESINPLGRSGRKKVTPKTTTTTTSTPKATSGTATSTPKTTTTTTGTPKTGTTGTPKASGSGDAAPRTDKEIHDNSSGGKSSNVEYKGPAGQVKAKEAVEKITGWSTGDIAASNQKKYVESKVKENKAAIDEKKADEKAKEEFEKERADKRFIRQPDETPETEETKDGSDTNEAYSDVKPTDANGENTNQWAYGALDASDVKGDDAETTDDESVEYNELEIPDDITNEYKKYAMRDAAMGAMNVATNLLDTALNGWNAMIKLANGLLLGNKISDPTGAARALVTGVVNAGAVAQKTVNDIGAFWGIKDGVQQKDVIGTYKGARHYKELAEAKAVQREFSTDLDDITKEVFGEDADPKNLDQYLSNAIKEKDVAKVKGVVMGLKKRYDTPRMRQYEAMVAKEVSDKNNDAIPKDQKYRAPPAAKMYHRMYMEFMRGAVNSAEKIGAISAREAAELRHLTQNMGEIHGLDKKKKNLEIEQKKYDDMVNAENERSKNEESWYNNLNDVGRGYADIIKKYDNTAFNELQSSNGMPIVTDPTKLNRIIKQMRLRKSQLENGLKDSGEWSATDEEVLQHLEKLANNVNPEREMLTGVEKDKKDLATIYEGTYSDQMGGSSKTRENNKIKSIALSNMERLADNPDDPEYKQWQGTYIAADMAEMSKVCVDDIIKYRHILDPYLQKNPLKFGKYVCNDAATLLKAVRATRKDCANYFNGYGKNDVAKVKKGLEDGIDKNLGNMQYEIKYAIKMAKKGKV